MTHIQTTEKLTKHTPGPWKQDWHFIVALDPDGIHPDLYIAEIAEEDSDGRVASPEQQAANARLIVAAPELFAACRIVLERWERCDFFEAARACQTAVTLATDGYPSRDITSQPPIGSQPYSVLLLYPDDLNDSGTETYYSFVVADNPIEAVTLAQRQAATAQEGIAIDPADFAPLFVTQGHHESGPLFDKPTNTSPRKESQS